MAREIRDTNTLYRVRREIKYPTGVTAVELYGPYGTKGAAKGALTREQRYDQYRRGIEIVSESVEELTGEWKPAE